MVGAFALLIVAIILLATPDAGAGGRSACAKWGDTKPARLTPPRARRAIRCFVNKARSRHGLSRIGKNRRLQRAAQKHTRYMVRHHCFSHQCPGEGSLDTRVRSSRYINGKTRSWGYGEDIGAGRKHRGTPRRVFHTWMHSPGHRANILDRDFRDAGVGFVIGLPSKRHARGGTYTVDLGYRHG